MFSKKVSGLAVVAAFALGISGNAAAGTANANLTVSATVAQNCTISANPLAFGAYLPLSTHAAAGVDLSGEGSLVISCTKSSTGIEIGMGNGANFSGGRRMVATGSPTEFLNYNIYQPGATTANAACSGTTAWGTTLASDTLIPTGVTWGAGSSATFRVCGVIPKGQNPIPDTFTDTVQATVNF